MADFITRFAPSPTGLLHLGHAYSACQAFSAAKKAGGQCLLRIEDTDRTRCKPAFESAILEDLTWLGFEWPSPVRRQSEHLSDYQKALQQLRNKGLIYRCFKTRREILDDISRAPHIMPASRGEPVFIGSPLPPEQERKALEADEPFAWRLSMVACQAYLGSRWAHLQFVERGSGPDGETGTITVHPDLFGDVVLARKDTGTSYHIACVNDDALQGVSHIIRGQDLFMVTHFHTLLQALLDLPTPIYHHHALLTDENGKRFAKRDRAKTLRSLREEDELSPDQIFSLMEQHLPDAGK